MVRDGWALAFVKYSDRYAADQGAAEAAKAGLWAGSFVKPWEWRLGEAQAAQKTRRLRHQGQHQPEMASASIICRFSSSIPEPGSMRARASAGFAPSRKRLMLAGGERCGRAVGVPRWC